MVYTVVTLLPSAQDMIILPTEKELPLPARHSITRDFMISYIESKLPESAANCDADDILKKQNEMRVIDAAFDKLNRPYAVFTQSDFTSCNTSTAHAVRSQDVHTLLEQVYLIQKTGVELVQNPATQSRGHAILETLRFIKRPLAQALYQNYHIGAH